MVAAISVIFWESIYLN